MDEENEEPWVCHIAFGNKTPQCRRDLAHIFCQTMNAIHRVYLDEEEARARQEQRLTSLKRPGLWHLLKRGWL